MDAMERVNRKDLPESLPAVGKSRQSHRQIVQDEPAILAQRTGKNCALSVRDQLLDKSLVIRVNFSEIDRAIFEHSMTAPRHDLAHAITKEN
ncbi:hypothetical protein [Cryobacterium zongtaii]|uniref:hypothetical protein n=1 Tax=Cryobacterium zongtaii TaxID=1259217 RepID=UPI0010572D04|nr:hypothetical protein [Cryobacterium zongtaii]